MPLERNPVAALFALAAMSLGLAGTGQAASLPVAQTTAAPARDGQRDFDFETGTWTADVRVLRNPLSGKPAEWAVFSGTSIVRLLQNGRANLVELSVKGPTGSIEGVSLRLYDPAARQWTLNYASLRDGALTAPVSGGFDNRGRGAFFGRDSIGGKAVRVRFVITQTAPNEANFEQAYSADDGVTWEVNWIATDRRR